MTRRTSDLRLAAVGTVALALTWLLARQPTVSRTEEEAFRWVNRWPDWLQAPTWPAMQLGAAAMIPVAALVVYVAWRRLDVAGAVFAAGGAAWILAKVVKALVGRGRPQSLLDDVILRPDWAGLGFVSGHAAVAFAMAAVVSPHLRRPWRVVLWAAATFAALLRMYTAAHLPLDLIGGAGLGLALGSLIRIAAPAVANTEPSGPRPSRGATAHP